MSVVFERPRAVRGGVLVSRIRHFNGMRQDWRDWQDPQDRTATADQARQRVQPSC